MSYTCTRDARDRTRSNLIGHGWVDQTGYELELCAHDHQWYQRCVQREQAIAHHTLGWKSMAIVILEPGHSGTAYT